MKFLPLLTIMILQINGCPNKDERCGSCTATTCEYCYDGFINMKGVCEKSSVEIENCLTYQRDKTCKKCVFGFYLKNGVCIKIPITNCLRVNERDSCLVCDNGLPNHLGICDGIKKCEIPDCKYCGYQKG